MVRSHAMLCTELSSPLPTPGVKLRPSAWGSAKDHLTWMKHSSSCPGPFSSAFHNDPTSFSLLLGGGISCPVFFTSAQGWAQTQALALGPSLGLLGGTHPSLGSAVIQTLSSPQSESMHQAENLFLGPVCSQQSCGPTGEKDCRSGCWRRMVLLDHARARAV